MSSTKYPPLWNHQVQDIEWKIARRSWDEHFKQWAEIWETVQELKPFRNQDLQNWVMNRGKYFVSPLPKELTSDGA